MNVQDILDVFSQVVDDPSSEGFSSADRELLLRESYHEVYASVLQMNSDYAIRWVDISTATDFVDIAGGVKAWEPPFELSNIVHVEVLESVSQISVLPINIISKNYYYNRPTDFQFAEDGWFFLGDRIAVRSDIGNKTLRIYYTRRWPELHLGTFSSGGMSTTGVFQTAPANLVGRVIRTAGYYVDAKIEVISGAGNVAGQQRRISAYSPYTNPTITVSQAWTTTPANGDIYSLVPEFREEFHMLLPKMMAMKAFRKRGNASALRLVAAEVGHLQEAFDSCMSVRQEQQVRQVIDVEEPW